MSHVAATPAPNDDSDTVYIPQTVIEPKPVSAVSQVRSLKAKAASRGIGQKASVTISNAQISVRKPKQSEWVRVHPDADNFSLILPVVPFGSETADDQKQMATRPTQYVIHPDLLDHPTLTEDATRQAEFNLAITRAGKVFIWGHSFLDKENTWVDSETSNIAAARKVWIRQISDTAAGVYNRRESVKSFGEPSWPARDFESLLLEALGDKFVADESHPLFKMLVGLV